MSSRPQRCCSRSSPRPGLRAARRCRGAAEAIGARARSTFSASWGRGDDARGHAAQEVSRKGGRGPLGRRVRISGCSFYQQTMPYGDVIRAFAEPDAESTGLSRAHHAVCVCRGGNARREAEHPRRLQERRDQQHDLPLVLRRAQGRVHEETNWKPEHGDPSLEDIETYLEELRRRAGEIHLPRPVQHLELLHAVALLQGARRVRDESLAQPASHSDRGRAASLDQQHGSGHPVARTRRPIWPRCGTAPRRSSKGTTPNGRELLFIPIPTAVPNDFLVASGISEQTAAADRRRHQEGPRRRPPVHGPAGVAVSSARFRCGRPAARASGGRGSAEGRLRRLVRVGQQRQRGDRRGARGAGEAASGCAPAARRRWS